MSVYLINEYICMGLRNIFLSLRQSLSSKQFSFEVKCLSVEETHCSHIERDHGPIFRFGGGGEANGRYDWPNTRSLSRGPGGVLPRNIFLKRICAEMQSGVF